MNNKLNIGNEKLRMMRHVILNFTLIFSAFLSACTDVSDVTDPDSREDIAGWYKNGGMSSFIFSSSSINSCVNTDGVNLVTDCRDGQTYKTVAIGTQTWMAENMNYQTLTGSWCYGNNNAYCDHFGRLYNFMTANVVCPSGWHLPNDNEWQTLELYLGVNEDSVNTDAFRGLSGPVMANDTIWLGGAGSNLSGFSALPGGRSGGANNSDFYDVRTGAYFWTASVDYGSTALTTDGKSPAFIRIICFDCGIGRFTYGQSVGLSVRCIKDQV